MYFLFGKLIPFIYLACLTEILRIKNYLKQICMHKTYITVYDIRYGHVTKENSSLVVTHGVKVIRSQVQTHPCCNLHNMLSCVPVILVVDICGLNP